MLYFVLYVITICLVFILFLILDIKSKIDNYFKKKNRNKVITSTLVIGVIFIIASFFAPHFFTKTQITEGIQFSDKTAHVGDTLAIMNPFIALVSVAFTFLAFYMQKIANDEIKNQFKIQQFESQFYEMLHLHKENVNEMELVGKDWSNNQWQIVKYSKREVFKQMKEEFECLLKYVTAINESNPFGKEIFISDYKKCYHIFFWGWDYKIIEQNEHRTIRDKDLKAAYQNQFETNLKRNIPKIELKYPAFQGHSSSLGHYFRHLFMIVKFVVDSQIITEYESKMSYLKILRAQLSNYEQIMLFYNWISGYGEDWENDENKFFTEYCMIHNLWKDELLENLYTKQIIQDLINKQVNLRTKSLFEFQE